MHYFLVVGERSGDLHAANLMSALKEKDPEATFTFYGGDRMNEVGGEMIKHYREYSAMGAWEVIKNLKTIKKALKQAKDDVIRVKPDALIMVDFSAFNMKIAPLAKKHGIPTLYYISPKVWAWNTKRAWKVKKYIDQLYCILPFEVDFFKRYDYDVVYAGNPILDEIAKFKANVSFEEKYRNQEVVAILPGSRKQEVKSVLNRTLPLISAYKDKKFIVAGVDNLPDDMYQEAKEAGAEVLFNKTYDILHVAKTAVVTSGTATLETALFQVPQVVVYRTSFLTALIAKMVLKIPYVSLANLAGGKQIVEELLQYDFNTKRLKKELELIFPGGEERPKMEKHYADLKVKMGEDGISERLAGKMVDYLSKR